MNTLSIGRSSLRGSRIAYGCWRIAGTPHPGEISHEREARAVESILTAYESGFTVFDLADVYSDGKAEVLFGQALRANPGMREKIILVTKGGIVRKGEPHNDSPYRYDSTAAYLKSACEASLKRLGVDRVDLYLIHRPDYLMNPEEVAKAFADLRDAGKVREFGISNFTVSQAALLQQACPMPLAAHQIEINLAHLDAFHNGALDQCLSLGMTPMGWSPLAGGRLAANTPIDLHDTDHAKRAMLRDALEHVARAHHISRGVAAVAWLLQHPAQIQPVIGTTNPQHIRDFAAADNIQFSREQWYQLMEAAQGHRLP